MFTPTSIEPASIAFNLISTFLCFLCFLCFSSHSSFHFWGANLATCLGSLRGGGYLARRVLGSSDSLHMQINDKLRCVFCSAALMSWMRQREEEEESEREAQIRCENIFLSFTTRFSIDCGVNNGHSIWSKGRLSEELKRLVGQTLSAVRFCIQD